MYEPYEDDEDDGYPDDDFNNDWSDPLNPKTWYYKFDFGPNTPISNWISDIVSNFIGPLENKSWDMINMPGFDVTKFPVNSWNPNTDKGNSSQYLGSNYQGSPIWKKKYFVIDRIQTEYKMHIQSHVVYFLQQPAFYKGLFEVLN